MAQTNPHCIQREPSPRDTFMRPVLFVVDIFLSCRALPRHFPWHRMRNANLTVPGFAAISALVMLACGAPNSGRTPSDVFAKIECLEDASAKMDLPAVRRSSDWRPCAGDMLDTGFSKSAFWFRMSRPRAKGKAIITFRWKTLSRVDQFTLRNGIVLEKFQAGDERLRSVWPMVHGDVPAFPIKPRAGNEYYFRVWSKSIKRFPIQAHTEESFQRYFDRESMVIWTFAGIIFTVVFLSAIFSIGLREAVYFYYGLYTAALWMSLNSIYGNTYRVFWPDSPWLADKAIFFTQGVTLWVSILFFRKVSRLDMLSPRTDAIAKVFQYIAAFLIPLTLLDLPRVIFSRIYSFTYLFAIPTFIFVMSRLVIVKKQRNLIPFALGWGLYYSMGIVHLTYLFGLVPYHPLPVFGMVLMLPVETLVFGGGLFVRYRSILQERAKLEREKNEALERLKQFHNPTRYSASKLENLDVDELLLRLDRLLDRERIYRDEELSLKKMAGLLGISGHQLSELLNSRLGVSFPTLLVNYRVRDAARLLLEAPEKTVLTIGLEVGFNSKTAFNVAFKKIHGESPTRYRSRNRPGES